MLSTINEFRPLLYEITARNLFAFVRTRNGDRLGRQSCFTTRDLRMGPNVPAHHRYCHRRRRHVVADFIAPASASFSTSTEPVGPAETNILFFFDNKIVYNSSGIYCLFQLKLSLFKNFITIIHRRFVLYCVNYNKYPGYELRKTAKSIF